MGLSKNITLTIKDYEIKLDKEIKFYENDTIDLCFSILEYGIEVKDGISINKLMPIQALRSYMLIETPHGIDYAESTKIEDNKIVFNLGTKYSQFVGIGRMQIVVKDSDGCRVTLPEFEFEIKESINMNWDRESFDFLATEDESIIIDEFGRKIHMSKISDMPESENMSEEAYAMIIDEEGNKRFKVSVIADAVEDSLDSKFNAYTDEINGDVEEFKGAVRTDVTTLTNENNTFKNQVNTRLADYGSDYNSFKDNVETRLGEHMTDYNRFKDGVETRIEENENTYDGFVSNVSTVLDNYGSSYNAFKSEVNRANASFQSTLNASNQAFRNEMVDRYDNFVYKIDEDIFEGGRTDYFGETHETIGERLELDFDNVHRRIDESELLDYEGYAITADSSYYGLQRETKIQGRTLQNLGTTRNNGMIRTLHATVVVSTLIKPNTTHTMIIRNKANEDVNFYWSNHTFSWKSITVKANGILVDKNTSLSEIKGENCLSLNQDLTLPQDLDIVLLEGDHTNTLLEELPFIEGIESVGDKSKNLFYGAFEEGQINAETGEEIVYDGRCRSVQYANIEPNKTYTISMVQNVVSAPWTSVRLYKDNTFIETVQDQHGKAQFTFESGEANRLRVTANIPYNDVINCQIEEGTLATPYQEYYDDYKISGKSCGKNLFNINEFISPTAGYQIGYKVIEDDKIKLAMTDGKTGVGYIKTKLFKLKPNTQYTLSLKVDNTKGTANFLLFDGDVYGSHIFFKALQVQGGQGSTSATFTTPNKEYYTAYIYPSYKSDDINYDIVTFSDIQLEESSKQTVYEPYQESTYEYILDEPLRSLPNGVHDELDLETGVLTRRVGKVVLDSNKNWKVSGHADWSTCYCHDYINTHLAGKGLELMCDRLKTIINYDYLNANDIVGGISVTPDGYFAVKYLPHGTKPTLSEVKEYFQANPTTVYYELVTPITEQLSEQRINSFDGITHVISDNKIMPKTTTRIPTDLGNNVNNRLNNLNDKIDDHKNETDNACVDYFGYDHPSLQDRLMSDFDKLNTKIEGYGYISYEGTSIYATNTMEGSVNNTVVKGKTLQNLTIGEINYIFGTSGSGRITKEVIGKFAKYTAIENGSSYITCRLTKSLSLIKPNTTYTIIFTILENTIPNYKGITIAGASDSHYSTDINRLLHNSSFDLSVGTKIVKFTTGSDISGYTGLGFGFPIVTSSIEAGKVFYIGNVILLEGDHTNTLLEELPFIEGIESVGDKSKNLIVITPNKRIERSGITLFENDGKLFADGTTSKVILANETIWDELIKWNAEEGKQYKVSIFNPISNMTATTRTITDDVYNSTVGIYIPTDITFENYEIKIQVEEGTSTTKYNPPYDGYKISGKSCGKNLIDLSTLQKSVDNNEFEFLENGKVLFKGAGVSSRTQPFVEVKVNPNINMAFTAKTKENNNSYVQIYSLNEGTRTSISAIYDFKNTSILKFNTGDTNTIAVHLGKHLSSDNDVTFYDVQLEEGETATPYQPYKESTYSYTLNEPLRSLPNGVCDTIDLETGVLTRRVGKVVFDGSENWSATGYGGHETRNTFELLLKTQGTSTINNAVYGYCDKFPYEYTSGLPKSDGARVVLNEASGYTNNYFLFSPPTSLIPYRDITAWKEYLSNNNVTVYHQLGYETTEQLTPQQLKSFDATTHIISDNKLMPIVSTKIPTDLGAMVNTLSLRNRELEEVNEQQDELIDITMMATDEMYSMLEPLMEAVEPMGLLDCSKMAQMYVAMVRRGIKKIEDVPSRYQEEVREALGIKIEEEWGEDDGIK